MTGRKVLIFAGTTEGRRLAQVLAENGVPCVVCVATEYGARVMQEAKGCMQPETRQTAQMAQMELKQGRLDAEEMRTLMQEEEFAAVIDATHPFAVEVSENIRVSAKRCGVVYLRLKRDTRTGSLAAIKAGREKETEGTAEAEVLFFESSDACAEFLTGTKGNVLLTTGSKEVAVYCTRQGLRERLYVRVLPGVESIGLCEKAGIMGGRILALQGPFSEELNYALLRQYKISYLVTKESGRAGGYVEKIAAAARAGIPVCVIGNPEKGEGLSFGQILERLGDLLGMLLRMRRKIKFSLIGVGMGSVNGLTLEAYEACRKADYVFGAKRLLAVMDEMESGGKEHVTCYPYYTAEAILETLEDLLEREEQETAGGELLRIAVLFSGDSGFYSGCSSVRRALEHWADGREEIIGIRVYPGISSVSYLAAATGQSWQDAAIFSTHGKGGGAQWRTQLSQVVKTHAKTFVLTSGVEDVQDIGDLFQQEELSLFVGFDLSYPGMQVREYSPQECKALSDKGSYTCLIINKRPEPEKAMKADEVGIVGCVTHGLPDTAFLREEKTMLVPMTKEEVREVAISKLRLTPDAVVFDIGSGTGSVAVEIARLLPDARVYALEHKPEAAELTGRNATQFGVDNLTVVQTRAPEGIEKLPVPTHVFIGGSDGALREILEKLWERNPAVRVVVTAVSLETVAELTELMKTWENAELVNLQVSRAKLLGRHHLMRAENPVYIMSFGGEETE